MKRIFILLIICNLLIPNFIQTAKAYSDDKPLFVEISTDWCFACNLLKPTIEELKNQYAGQVTFIRLNLTDEETTKEAEELAKQYGITEFLNNNRNAFPRVAIFCTSGLSPEKNLLGAQPKDVYEESLNSQIASNSCNLSSDFKLADLGDGRPDESTQINIPGGRPDEAELSGRPQELQFWTYGQALPVLGYYIISRCAADNQILCSNLNAADSATATDDKPQFKPYNPNATRNEKGFNNIVN